MIWKFRFIKETEFSGADKKLVKEKDEKALKSSSLTVNLVVSFCPIFI